MSDRSFLVDQLKVGTIFSIVGTYGKPFLRMRGGYADMSNGDFQEVTSSLDTPVRCRILSEQKLATKYGKTLHWVTCWKGEIEKIVEKKRSEQ